MEGKGKRGAVGMVGVWWLFPMKKILMEKRVDSEIFTCDDDRKQTVVIANTLLASGHFALYSLDFAFFSFCVLLQITAPCSYLLVFFLISLQ